MPATPVGSLADCGNKTPLVVEVTSKTALAFGVVVPIPTFPVELVVPDAAALVVPVTTFTHNEPLMATSKALVVLLKMTKPALGDLMLASRSVVVSLGNNKPTAEPLAVMSNAAEAAGVVVPIPICEKVGLLKTNAIAIRIRIRLMRMCLTIS